jgi:hypothetical protein
MTSYSGYCLYTVDIFNIILEELVLIAEMKTWYIWKGLILTNAKKVYN